MPHISRVCCLGLLPAAVDEEPVIGTIYNQGGLLKLFTWNILFIADIHLLIDKFRIIATITEESRTVLGIREDDFIFAIFKASFPQVVREGYSQEI